MKPLRLGLLIAALLPAYVGVAQTKSPSQGKAAGAANASGFEALVKKAEAARGADQTDEAIRLYKQAVRIWPEFAEGWWYLGMLYYEADQYADGRAAFHHLTGLRPEMALGWAMLGLCEFETKDFDSALAHLEKADELKIPSEQGFYDVSKYHFALLLIRSGRFESAVKIIGDFARQGKDSPQFTEAMGLAALRKPLLPSELPPLERELVLDVGRAMCASAARRAAEAERDRLELLRKYPNTPQVHYLAGTMALANDSDKALDEWNAELAISPEHPQALVSIAAEYLKRGEYQTALPSAEKSVEVSPNYFAAHAILGQILAEGDLDVPRGMRELETAVRLAPWQPQVHFALATAYARAGRKADAAKEREEFMRLRGPNETAVSKPR
jgi:tetratricopeptide (TPR) repeat protein